MDVINILSPIIILTPFLYGVVLLIARIKLLLLNKKFLNYGLFTINGINLILALALLYFVNVKNEVSNLNIELFDISNIHLNFGISVSQNNVLFLVFGCLFYFVINLFVVHFFKQKKQFLFTKQRYYILLSFLITLTYCFLMSANLLQSLILFMLQGVVVYLFVYFDIFKINTKANISRFLRLNLFAEFCFFTAFLLFFKYSVLAQDLISDTSICFDKLNLFFSYLIGISSPVEYKFALILILLFVFSKLVILPFSCYYSFFANSSDVTYLPVYICINNFIGAYIYLNFLAMFDYFPDAKIIVYALSLLTIITSIIFLSYEKNIKIIFGYVLSIVNSIFLYFAIFYKQSIIIYFCALLLLLLFAVLLFSKDKINLKRRIINKYKGFYLERLHILLFEAIPNKLSKFLIVSNEYVFKILCRPFLYIINLLVNIFAIKYLKNSKIKIIRNIFFVFGIFIVFIILTMLFLFGGIYFG